MSENRWAGSEAEAILALEAYMAALNAGDDQALFDTMHVPHVRISGEGVAIYNTREDLEKNYLEGFSARAGDSWHHTVLDSTQVIHSSEKKSTCSFSSPVTTRMAAHWSPTNPCGS